MKVSHTCLPPSGKSAFESLNSSQEQKPTDSQCLLILSFPIRRKYSKISSCEPDPFTLFQWIIYTLQRARPRRPVWISMLVTPSHIIITLAGIHFNFSFLPNSNVNIRSNVSFAVWIQAEEYKEKEGQHCHLHWLHQSDFAQKEEGKSSNVWLYSSDHLLSSQSVFFTFIPCVLVTEKRLVLGWEHCLDDTGSNLQVGALHGLRLKAKIT